MKNSAPITHKKVVIRKLDKGLIKGFVNSSSFVGPTGVEVLDREGRLVHVPLQELKGIFFVREFDGNPQRPERKVFHARPKRSGLWVRMTFKDREVMEGVIANNLLDIHPLGFFITPPDLYSNNMRFFIPRSALTALEVLGVITEGAARRAAQQASAASRKSAEVSRQIGLFSESKEPGANSA